ncbi:tyrosine-type recombinase/integrase, partial [uncultured Parabacteroides sp.]
LRFIFTCPLFLAQPITFHVARHSFATVLKRSGANISYISESLGHSDLKTTEAYLASFEKEERQKNASLLTQF